MTKGSSKGRDEIVPEVKAILADSFHKAAAYTVVEVACDNQYMVTQRKGNMLNITMNAQGQNMESGKVEVNKSEVGHEMQSREKTNVLTVADKCCSCGDGRSTSTHACMPQLIFGKGNNWHFQLLFCNHVHDYY